MNAKKILVLSVLILKLSSVVASNKNLYNYDLNVQPPSPTIVPATGTIEVVFSPNNGVTVAIIKAIASAQKTILVAAYSFTSTDIAKALLEAKNKGVKVQLILDKSNVKPKYTAATFFINHGFDLRIDVTHAIFHDKVMIIDDNTVITGSFNFTKAAETKNAENILILRNNSQLAKLYTQDWLYNWNRAIPYDAVEKAN